MIGKEPGRVIVTERGQKSPPVIPAKAGIHGSDLWNGQASTLQTAGALDPGFRRDDGRRLWGLLVRAAKVPA